ncbi:MAG: class I SAM-dependent methyltransferase, partial [Bacteroidales bacterium]
TIEKNDELSRYHTEYFERSGFADRILSLTGNALEIIPSLDHQFDLVFIDADKSEYVNYYQLCLNKTVPGGFIIADNVLWDGKVLEGSKYNDKETRGIVEFNEFVANDTRVENVIIPFRDGISIIRKI